jgi:hypothetical protein
MNKKAYLGDGVYVSFDGNHIWLSTEEEDSSSLIALEPAVYRTLKVFAKTIGFEG